MKEQTLCTLWNLSVDEKHSVRMTSSEILPLLVRFLEDEDNKVREASGGVLAILALTQSNHKIMVEAGVIPKLVRLTCLLLFILVINGSSCYCIIHHNCD